jgi:hypothetical protein
MLISSWIASGRSHIFTVCVEPASYILEHRPVRWKATVKQNLDSVLELLGSSPHEIPNTLESNAVSLLNWLSIAALSRIEKWACRSTFS